MNTPESVIKAAADLIELFGSNFDFLGAIEGKDAYQFIFPEDEETGFPIVFLYNPTTGEAEKLAGWEALHITTSQF